MVKQFDLICEPLLLIREVVEKPPSFFDLSAIYLSALLATLT